MATATKSSRYVDVSSRVSAWLVIASSGMIDTMSQFLVPAMGT